MSFPLSGLAWTHLTIGIRSGPHLASTERQLKNMSTKNPGGNRGGELTTVGYPPSINLSITTSRMSRLFENVLFWTR